jgi:Na+/H+ antiporter NhaD/arsenite permease-like protein
MEGFSAVIAVSIFIGVIVAIVSEQLHLTVAAFLGALILVFAHIMTLQDAVSYIGQSYATLALFLELPIKVKLIRFIISSGMWIGVP